MTLPQFLPMANQYLFYQLFHYWTQALHLVQTSYYSQDRLNFYLSRKFEKVQYQVHFVINFVIHAGNSLILFAWILPVQEGMYTCHFSCIKLMFCQSFLTRAQKFVQMAAQIQVCFYLVK